MPDAFISDSGHDVTDEFRMYPFAPCWARACRTPIGFGPNKVPKILAARS